MNQGKSVRIHSEDEEYKFETDTAPLVPPPSATHHRKDERSCTVEMQREDPFFYQPSWVSNKTMIADPFEDTAEKEKGTTTTNENSAVEDDSDREFDWNDDPDSAIKPTRRRTARERFQAAMKTPCCWHYLSPLLKRIIIAFLGSCLFIVVAVVIYFTLPSPTKEEQQNPDFKNVRSNVQCWMYWAAFMWHIFWVTTFALDSVPAIVSLWIKIFRGRRSEKAKSYMEYYLSLKNFLCLVLLSAWNIGSWVFLINSPFPSIKLHPYSAVITKVFGCLLAAAGLFSIQKTVIQIIAIRFHRSAFKDRLAENKKSLKILDTLSKSEKKHRPYSGPALNNRHQFLRNRKSQAAPGEGEEPRRPVTLNDRSIQHPSSFNVIKKNLSNMILSDKPTSDVSGRMEKNKLDINSDDYAKKVAKKLYHALAHHEEDTKIKLEIHHFIPYFKEPGEAKEAFDVFDRDGNGNLTRREFRDTVVQIYRDRKGLAQAIRDTSQALGKIDTTLLMLTVLVTTLISLSIFRVDFWSALIPFGTLLAAGTFIFGSSCQALFQGIVFQFVTHPYDSGDLVQVDGTYMFVENIGILGTVFVGADGTKMYAPTTVLQTKIIANVRRSGSMGETVTFNIDFRTQNETILLLREKLSDWVHAQSRDFASGFDLRIAQILDMNQIILNAWLPHKGNWVELGKRHQRKTQFMLALKSTLTELNIHYELPAQRITSTTSQNAFNTILNKPQDFAQEEAARSN
ncbi:hypothetical protein BY458DRAFT_541266 [Sporodiniella umbellata]|nr:hypothetical protein BY458DRAFT_541266 [Sporodiniella umbellata]